MFSELDTQTRLMLSGNVWLIVCCAFYLLWWILAFKPTNPIKGFTTGWLLIPAVICGVMAIIQIIRGATGEGSREPLMNNTIVAIVGAACFVVLLLISSLALKRTVTTELLLIVGWGTLMFVELNALYSQDLFSRTVTIVLLVITVVLAAVSIVCYLLYYDLDDTAGFIDGMIPLLIVMVMMIAVTVSCVVISRT